MSSLEVGNGVGHDEKEGVGEEEGATLARAEARQHEKDDATHTASERHANTEHRSQNHTHDG